MLLEPAVADAALKVAKDIGWQAAPTLVYLANSIKEGDQAIRKTIAHLHEKILGRYDSPDSAEVERTFKLFAAIVKDASERKGLDKQENYSCRPNDRDRPGATSDDPHYTIRAWRSVVTYLLRRSEFLYE